MSDRFAAVYVCTSQAKFDIRAMATHFATYGIALEHPHKHEVAMLLGDGSQLFVSVDAFLKAFGANGLLSFQWWLSESEDIYCRFKFGRNATIVEFGLDGLDQLQESAFSECLTTLFKMYIDANEARGLVIDRQGDTVGYDWTEFFCGAQTVTVLPDMMAAPISALGRIRGGIHKVNRLDYSGFAFISKA